ncbi:pentatricopeptide repeat-containing protein At4g13650-like [Cornus florida]|uniref:pentatricopeptide repeat-containing protein At4g13650-like n=1 Tax=Cornus florida TaxID=4283 RepID=UPI0028A2ACED|nr:pentatricopeptide repeat-containing protein At4g13650-like [Cornus florida]
MLENKAVAWTSKILANARNGLNDKALACFKQLLRAAVEPNAETLSTTITVCARSSQPSFGTSLHCLVVKNGFMQHFFLASGLITMYSKCGCITKARRVFDEMLKRDAVSWNSMIAGYSQMGLNREAYGLFYQMINDCSDWKLFVNSFTLASVLKACAGLGCPKIGTSVHCCAIKLAFDSDMFVVGSTIDMYSKCGCLNMAHCVFDQMETRDLVAWNTMITGYAQNDYGEETIELFHRMQYEGFWPNETTYASVLKASTVLLDSATGRYFHAKTLKLGYVLDIYVGTSLVDMYSKFLDMENASRAFFEMKKRNLVSYNVLITGYSLTGWYEEAFRAYMKLQAVGMKPDSFTFIGLFSSFSVMGAVAEGAQVHSHSIMYGLNSDVLVGNSIVTFYCKCGLTKSALKAFESINTPNAISWAGIISGYAQNGEQERALEQFCIMHKSFYKTDEFSSSSALKAVASWTTIEHGMSLHAHLMKSGLECTIYIGSALIDMYSKCGMVEDACKVFLEMPEKNVVSWNSLIMGYAQNGLFKEALLLFQEMKDSRILPTSVTFVGVLFACSHAGLVEEGRNYYKLMVYNYGIPPSVEHCTCMVDLLGRAGYLEEAETFLLDCPFSKEFEIWGSLLAACGVHRNSDVGSRAAQHLLQLQPHHSSMYTSLSNLYASKELWTDVTRIRDLMKEMGVEKEPGCSWLRYGT